MKIVLRISLIVAMLLTATTMLLADTPAAPAPPAVNWATWTDKAPHVSKMANIGSISLNYLDFGGSGPALIIIPGLNDTAHIFDDLAPKFVASYHVYAISRRGCGDSDKPATGYDTETRVADILGFMKALNIDKAILAGHSIAGDELTVFAKEHPDHVAKLIYFDAAYDRSIGMFAPFGQMTQAHAVAVSTTPSYVLASLDSYRLYWQTFAAGAWNDASEANMRDKVVVNKDGSLTEKCPSAATAEFLIATATLHPDESAVKAPALCFFATFGDMTKLGASADIAKSMTDWQSGAVQAAKDQMHATVVSLPAGTSHYLFIQYPDQVVSAMKTFLAN